MFITEQFDPKHLGCKTDLEDAFYDQLINMIYHLKPGHPEQNQITNKCLGVSIETLMVLGISNKIQIYSMVSGYGVQMFK